MHSCSSFSNTEARLVKERVLITSGLKKDSISFLHQFLKVFLKSFIRFLNFLFEIDFYLMMNTPRLNRLL